MDRQTHEDHFATLTLHFIIKWKLQSRVAFTVTVGDARTSDDLKEFMKEKMDDMSIPVTFQVRLKIHIYHNNEKTFFFVFSLVWIFENLEINKFQHISKLVRCNFTAFAHIFGHYSSMLSYLTVSFATFHTFNLKK